MEQTIQVFAHLRGSPRRVGTLWTRFQRGRESASFAYDTSWLESEEAFALEPALSLSPNRFHTEHDQALFGAFDDSAPGRWGRMLMRRNERRLTKADGRPPRALHESKCLLQVSDAARQGALQYKTDPDGPFLASEQEASIPPLVNLQELLAASERVVRDMERDQDLKLLVAPGSSMGGARPKAAVLDRNGSLALAKFPHNEDDYDTVLWECVALSLAVRAGIRVPNWRIEKVGTRPVLLLRRFDRVEGARIPFLSAMTMLGALPSDTRSYLEIADAISAWGSSPQEDRLELWRRVVFSILISNTDDHLKNHGFLYDSHLGWRLSPAYDLNPVPTDVRPRILSTTIGLDDATASIELALETASHYGLSAADAKTAAGGVAQAASAWRDVAGELGVSQRQIERMESAFEHADATMAKSLRSGT